MADQREMNFFCFTPSTKSKTCEFFLSLLSAKDGKSSGGGGGGGRESSSQPRFHPSVFFSFVRCFSAARRLENSTRR